MRIGFRVAVLAGAAAATMAAVPARVRARAAQDRVVVLTAQYAGLVRQYADGRAADAVSALAAWPAEDAGRAVERFTGIVDDLQTLFLTLGKLEPPGRVGVDPNTFALRRAALIERIRRAYDAVETGEVGDPDTGRGARQPEYGRSALRRALDADNWRLGLPPDVVARLRAAVGLHTAVAADAWRGGVPDRLAEHLEFANAYMADLLVRFDPGYAADWCRIAGTLLTSSQQQGLALKRTDRCLAWFPNDPALLLVRGSARESAAQAMDALPPGAMLAQWPESRPAVATEKARAAADYQRAVALDPGLDEARIRLGRLRLASGDLESAGSELDRAAAAPQGSVPWYWRSLLLGALAEARKKPDEAAAQYRAALRAYPNGQAAAVALSHVMAESLGDRAGAAQVLREHLAASPTRVFTSDPWWLYYMGQAWRVSSWLDDLARRSRTRADER